MLSKRITRILLLVFAVVLVLSSFGNALAASININGGADQLLALLSRLRAEQDDLRDIRGEFDQLELWRESNIDPSIYTDEYIAYLLSLDSSDEGYDQAQNYLSLISNYESQRNQLFSELNDVNAEIRQTLNEIISILDWPFITSDFNETTINELYDSIMRMYEDYAAAAVGAAVYFDGAQSCIENIVTTGEARCLEVSDYVAVTLHANRDDAFFSYNDYYYNSPYYHYVGLSGTSSSDSADTLVVLMKPDQAVEVFDPYSFFICLDDNYGPATGDGIYCFTGWDEDPNAVTPTLRIHSGYTVDRDRELYAVWNKVFWKTTVELEYDEVPYDGTAKCPGVTVRYGDQILTEGVDYTVSYGGNVQVSNPDENSYAYVYLTGIGEWTESRSLRFTITDPNSVAPRITSQPKDLSVAAGNTASFTVVSSGEDLSYRWMVSQDDGSSWSALGPWDDIDPDGWDTDTLSFTASPDCDGWKFRCRVSNDAGSVLSGMATLTVTDDVEPTEPMITSHPTAKTVAAGSTVTFKVVVTVADSYQWQYSDDGSTWKNCSSTGYNNATFSFKASTGLNNRQYRCKVTNSAGTTTSSAAKLTVVGIKTQPTNQTVAVGAQATFKVVATGAASYQWQWSADGNTWKNCSSTGYNKATFSFKASDTLNGRQYRCRITNGSITVTSNAGKLTVTTAAKPTITTQPTNQSVTAGSKATFKVVASGATSYQWQWSANGTTWTDCKSTGYNTATFAFTASASLNGRQYRCIVTNSAGSTTSNAAKLTVTSAVTKPTITTQPTDKTVTSGTSVTFKVVATGTSLTYQWQWSGDNGKTWKNCTSTGYNTASFSFKASAALNGRMYRCVVKNSAGSATSTGAKLTVSDVKPTITVQPANQTATVGTKATFSVIAAGSGLKYQWQYSDNGTTWTNCKSTGYNTATFTFTASASLNGRQYRCVVSNSYGSVTSSAGKLTVK